MENPNVAIVFRNEWVSFYDTTIDVDIDSRFIQLPGNNVF